ncbi:MAG TPA: helix-turn-helix transcriptional regulator [Mycobacteriales bacterium]|jgi:transcriptional regulator with XRE-family HTH domain|nr:helix-turn-helix transcriptional regulator [Mycobacteriales bacterium]
MTAPIARPVGPLLRQWRERRRLSQLELSLRAEVSTRHLSFVETGRSRPTSEMILRLTEWLDVPLRDRNALLLAGGYAPAYPEHELDDAELAPVRAALGHLLAGHEPYPALVVDRRWQLLEANRAVGLLTAGVAADLLRPPVNVLRLALHPEGMAARVINLGTWRAHLLERLDRQSRATADPELAELLAELRGYPGGGDGPRPGPADIVVPLRLRAGDEELDLLSTTTVFGTPRDVTLAELAIESFFPAGPATAAALRRLAASQSP